MLKDLIVGSAERGPDLERTILWADGVERALVSTPGGALDVARAFVPSIVVVEGTDAPAAIGLLVRLRENAGTRRSSIVVVSRQAVPPEEELRQSGANLVLTGPVDPPLWNARLGELFVVPRRVRTRLLVRAVPRHDARAREPILAVARLVHANIVPIFDVGDDYFARERLEGATLQAILHKQGKLALDEALRILGPVAAAMDYAHSKGTIHRDIKPANLFVVADGTPKVMDFGVAPLQAPTIPASGQVVATP